LLRRRRRDTVF